MRAYITYDEGGIEELGETGKEKIRDLIDRADDSSGTIEPFGVGFYQSEEGFLEIRPVGKSQFMLWSDLITKRPGEGLLRSLIHHKANIDTVITGREAAADVARDYMDLSREEFERKHG